MTAINLTNNLLISMPALNDPNFHQTVSLICQHDERGALGVIINRLSDHCMGDIYDQLKVDYSNPVYADRPVYHGGPVHPELGLVLHKAAGEWESTLKIGLKLALTSSRDIIDAMATGNAPQLCNFTLGYAGWGPGQLEKELQENTWLNVAVDNAIIFETPVENRWREAVALIGIDISQISSFTGHS